MVGVVLKALLVALVLYTYYVVCNSVGMALQNGNYKSLFFIVMLTVGICLFVFYQRSVQERKYGEDEGSQDEAEGAGSVDDEPVESSSNK